STTLCRPHRRARPRRPHQRRSPRHPRSLPGRHAQNRSQLPRDVQKSEAGARSQIQGGPMSAMRGAPDIKSSNTTRISDDKLNKLAHTVADTLAEIDEVDFLEDRNTIRQEARKALTKLLLEEVKIDAAARQKIASQRRIIPEGSQEWDILYRKYYNDEVKKLGI